MERSRPYRKIENSSPESTAVGIPLDAPNTLIVGNGIQLSSERSPSSSLAGTSNQCEQQTGQPVGFNYPTPEHAAKAAEL